MLIPLLPNNIIFRYVSPQALYYDAKFATVFENAIKNKFEKLDTIIEVPSNYAQIKLDQIVREREIRELN